MAKTPISIRLESELLDWFKQAAPNGYQVLIQNVLREYRRDKERQLQKILGRGQQIFLQYHARCFWHIRKDLEVTRENIPIIQEGLRKYGGLEGLCLAEELELT